VRNKGGKVEKTRERDRESVHGREGERERGGWSNA